MKLLDRLVIMTNGSRSFVRTERGRNVVNICLWALLYVAAAAAMYLAYRFQTGVHTALMANEYATDSDYFRDVKLSELLVWLSVAAMVCLVIAGFIAGPKRIAASWGIILFLAVQLVIAYFILDIENMWWLMTAFIALSITVLFISIRPTHFFIGYLVISPVIFYFYQGDLGKGLPSISFDRVAIFLMCVFALLKTFSNRHRARKLLTAEWLLILFAVFAGFNLIILHQETGKGLFDNYVDFIVLPVIVYFLAKAFLVKKEHLRWAVISLILLGSINAASLVLEAHTGYKWWGFFFGLKLPLDWQDVGQGRGQGFWRTPHTTQIYCAMAIMLAVYMAKWSNRLWAKALYLVGILLMIGAIFYAYSRTGYIAFALIVFLVPLFIRGRRVSFVAFALALVIGISVAVPFLLSDKQFSRRMEKDTASARMHINATNINLIKHNPWIGVGYGKVQESFEQYVANIYHRRELMNSKYGLSVLNAPHNYHLKVIGEEGLIGGAMFYGAIILFLIHAMRLRKRLSTKEPLGSDLVTILALAAITNIIVLNMYSGPSVPFPECIFWLVFALIVRTGELSVEGKTAVAHEACPIGSPASIGCR